MNTILTILWLAGAGTFLVGVGGFVDGRKVDRRFKTGYKNNAPDTRNFGQAAKRVAWGVGICIVALAVTGLTSTNEHQQRDATAGAPTPASSSADTFAAAADSASTGLVTIPSSDDSNASGVSMGLNSSEQVVQSAPAPAPAEPVSPSAAAQSAPVAAADSGSVTACHDDGTFLGNSICKNATLAATYQSEIQEYQAAQNRIGGADVGVRIEQEQWLAHIAQECADMPCLIAAFDKRIADLGSRYRGG
ncbi:hypothetical protein PQR70_37125 [Paraburkholderia madseniana]|jgi:hypothetical protein|uniref:hypothetical protein n=1 Tax=Paraburkholderia madseniana TaxID=2599607 RepID=UPI0038B9EDD3